MAWGWWSPGDELPPVAVVVCPTDGGYTHAGILYADEDGGTEAGRSVFMHLAFHCLLQFECIPKPESCGFAILIPNLPRAVAEAVATRCRSIARNKPEIKYGFALEVNATFDADGHLLAQDDRGLNCSTFVLAVFRSVMVQLAKESSWPSGRAGDRERYTCLLGTLRKYIDRRYANDPDLLAKHQEFANKVAPDVASARIRPEETGGTCLSETLPVNFAECQTLGAAVLDRLYPPQPAAPPPPPSQSTTTTT